MASDAGAHSMADADQREAAGDAAAPQAAAPNDDSGGSADGSGSLGDGGSSNDNLAIVDDRQIIRTASVALRLAVDAVEDEHGDEDRKATKAALADAASDAAVKVRALATGSGGYVSASDGSGATVSVTMRVPSASYDTVMSGLSDIGDVTSRTESTKDVTDEMIDVKSRVESMTASVKRIRAMLSQAEKISDVIAIESELSSREADLESLQNRQAALKGQVALSTITATITAAVESNLTVAQHEDQSRFMAGLTGGWNALKSFGSGVAAFVGAILPWLPLIAIVAIAVIWVVRRRRHGTPALPSGPSGPDPAPASGGAE